MSLREPSVPFEISETDQMEVWCEGNGPASGHPRVFLHLSADTHEVVCPYCSKLFRLQAPRK